MSLFLVKQKTFSRLIYWEKYKLIGKKFLLLLETIRLLYNNSNFLVCLKLKIKQQLLYFNHIRALNTYSNQIPFS